MIGLAVALTAACGPDLAKQNFPRTTISASPAAGPVNDEAVSVANLRTIDTCALLDANTLAGLGKVDPHSADVFKLGECGVDVVDAGGKKISLDLQLADLAINAQVTGTIEGLPLEVNDDNGGCDAAAITDKSDSLAMTVHVNYPGGDACGAGRTALQEVLQRLHTNPPRAAQPAGSLVAVDFCTVVEDSTITGVLGRGSKKSVYGLHGCSWSGGLASGYLEYDTALAPSTQDGDQIDLGGGLTGYQKLETNAGKRCTITWLHLPARDGRGEVVSFQYNNYHDDAGNDDACGKTQTVVKSLLPKLPRA